MTDTTDPREGGSEHADLLGNLDPDTWHSCYNIHKLVAVTMRDAAAALRALEAKVLLLEQHIGLLKAENAHYLIGRDRLAGEVERLTEALEEREHDMHMRIRAGYDKAVADSWRAEVARLTSELEKARENEARYLWLRDLAVGSGMNGGTIKWSLAFYAPDSESDEAFDTAVDAARRAGEGEK